MKFKNNDTWVLLFFVIQFTKEKKEIFFLGITFHFSCRTLKVRIKHTKNSPKVLWHDFLKMSDPYGNFYSLKEDTHMLFSNSDIYFPLRRFSLSSWNRHSLIYPSWKLGSQLWNLPAIYFSHPINQVLQTVLPRSFWKQFFLLYPYSNLPSRSLTQGTTGWLWGHPSLLS